MRKNFSLLFLVAALAGAFNSMAQKTDSTAQQPDRRKTNIFLITGGVVYGTSLLILNEMWYKGYPRGKFHFFNDNGEWYKLDKFGHAFCSYQITGGSYRAFSKSGYSKKWSLIASGITSFVVMTPIEWLDGYSIAYGASPGDVLANTVGYILFAGQELVLNKQVVGIKYGFKTSTYAQFRPAVLGKNLGEQMLKDYNGQTFWISLDLHGAISEKIPPWLNLAFGYGADGMVFARPETNTENGFSSFRQYYLSFDLDLTYIKTNKKVVKALLGAISMVHVPFPALEFSQNKLRSRWLAF